MQANKFIAAVSLTLACASIPLASLADRHDEIKTEAAVRHEEKMENHDAARKYLEDRHAAAVVNGEEKREKIREDVKINNEKRAEIKDIRHEDSLTNREHNAAVHTEIKNVEAAHGAAAGVPHADDHHGDHHGDHK